MTLLQRKTFDQDMSNGIKKDEKHTFVSVTKKVPD